MAASVLGLLMLFDNEAQQVMEQKDRAGSAVIWHHRQSFVPEGS